MWLKVCCGRHACRWTRVAPKRRRAPRERRRTLFITCCQVWASESRRSVIFGGSFGFVLIMLAVFIFGFFGWLAAWAGYVVYGVTNDNLYTIQVRHPYGTAVAACLALLRTS